MGLGSPDRIATRADRSTGGNGDLPHHPASGSSELLISFFPAVWLRGNVKAAPTRQSNATLKCLAFSFFLA